MAEKLLAHDHAQRNSGRVSSIGLAGRKFGRLTAIRPTRADSNRRYLCQCDCGVIKEVNGYLLASGRTQSCGCLRREVTIRLHTGKNSPMYKHGLSASPEGRTWQNMLRRCYDHKTKEYHVYGGRGITVCARWRESLVHFVEDMGKRPSPKHSIDRIDVNGNYEPSNCRWATPREQRLNQRPKKLITHCHLGHEFSTENTYIAPSGQRFCKECRKRRNREHMARKRANAGP